MTHSFRGGFRRLAIVAAIGTATLGLAAGSALAASAGVTPSPSSASYGQPQGDHHKHVQRHCEFVELTGFAVDHDGQAQDVSSYTRTAAPNDQRGVRPEKVEVFQLAKVCESGEHLTVVDVTDPYAQESEQAQQDHHGDQSPAPYSPQS